VVTRRSGSPDTTLSARRLRVGRGGPGERPPNSRRDPVEPWSGRLDEARKRAREFVIAREPEAHPGRPGAGQGEATRQRANPARSAASRRLRRRSYGRALRAHAPGGRGTGAVGHKQPDGPPSTRWRWSGGSTRGAGGRGNTSRKGGRSLRRRRRSRGAQAISRVLGSLCGVCVRRNSLML
jgi:hypothetical protein